jgi:hypothetical protein
MLIALAIWQNRLRSSKSRLAFRDGDVHSHPVLFRFILGLNCLRDSFFFFRSVLIISFVTSVVLHLPLDQKNPKAVLMKYQLIHGVQHSYVFLIEDQSLN